MKCNQCRTKWQRHTNHSANRQWEEPLLPISASIHPHTGYCVCPTISLMQDQHAILTAKDIRCTYLGSAQVDKTLETTVFQSQDLHRQIFVTPEWLFKDVNLKRVKDAAIAKSVTLIAVDKAHLIAIISHQLQRHFPTTHS